MHKLILIALAMFSISVFAQDGIATGTSIGVRDVTAAPKIKTVRPLPTVGAPVCCKGKLASDDQYCSQYNGAEAPACANNPKCYWVPGCGGITVTPTPKPACCTGTGSDGVSCNSLTAQGQTRCEAMKCTWQNPCQN